MTPFKVFVVDDEESIRQGICTVFEETYRVFPFETAEAALAARKEEAPDLILLDIGLPGMQGVDALVKFKEAAPDTPVVMITAYEDVSTVISAMKAGAFDYILKPINTDALQVTMGNALESVTLRREVQALQDRLISQELPFFIAESDAIQNVLEAIRRVAKSKDTPVLILGETGTGKELIASAIHYRSPNFRGPFVPVNCASIPSSLIESELFGYEKGAFTGAGPAGKKGLIEEAKNGTLFLDEVGDLSLDAQAKLLRFLESGEFYRVGSTAKRQVLTRVVSATNRDLNKMMDEERFRKDLFYRLGVIRVEVPSLSQRQEDILPLAKHFLLHFNQKFGKEFNTFSRDSETILLNHAWTGNIRELRNIIERAVLMGDGNTIQPSHLGLDSPQQTGSANPLTERNLLPDFPETGLNLPAVLNEMESRFIKEALQRAKGNESEAARLLNMNHHTFRYRRKKLNL